ncbi:PREDICTED: uncharacterized protein LOC108561643 isoform X2 [Nicrophorus vespilloides]|uniref:Regulatory protein zeste n=1 Tax=Nicrophorus vespilloides TaxID=110193 RepID=A0ABM1MKR2_NICVS|nr:PREDICTED: uncharacterized protein LOC108561643 isoform X2 [Nicrophorus vespilloides]
MDKGKRNRTRNYSEREKCLLLALVKEFSHIIDNKATDASTVRLKNQTWLQITDKYNVEADSGERRVDQLKTLYDNLKRKARKGIGFENTEMYTSNMDHPQIVRIQAALDENLEKILRWICFQSLMDKG